MGTGAARKPAAGASAPWQAEERAVLETLDSPAAIQAFLDSIPYSTDPIYRSPRSVLRDRKAHCFDGAVFAAAALRRLGQPARLLDLRAVRDDDHVIALFTRHRHCGAIAKSNYVTMRYREPVYRTLRELALSFFDFYFNLDGEKSMRSYSRPLDLRTCDALAWEVEDAAMETIVRRLDAAPHTALLTAEMERDLAPADERSFRAALLGADPAGLYKPPGFQGPAYGSEPPGPSDSSR